jgi:hypothetical protein
MDKKSDDGKNWLLMTENKDLFYLNQRKFSRRSPRNIKGFSVGPPLNCHREITYNLVCAFLIFNTKGENP